MGLFRRDRTFTQRLNLTAAFMAAFHIGAIAALFFMAIGGIEALLIRTQLFYPDNHFVSAATAVRVLMAAAPKFSVSNRRAICAA